MNPLKFKIFDSQKVGQWYRHETIVKILIGEKCRLFDR